MNLNLNVLLVVLWNISTCIPEKMFRFLRNFRTLFQLRAQICPKYSATTLSFGMSSIELLLQKVIIIKTSNGKRAFQHFAPILWNNLPSEIKCIQDISLFKKRLKTYLFGISLILSRL